MNLALEQWKSDAGLEDWTDEDVIAYHAQELGNDVDYWANHFGYEMPEGNYGKSWEAAKSGYMEGMNQVGNMLGLDREEAIRQRQAEQALMDMGNTGVRSFEDVNGLGDFAEYAGHLAVGSAPYLAETVGGAVLGGTPTAARLLGTGLSAASRARTGSVAAGVASYPSSVGDIARNQYDQSGEYDAGYALTGGAAYAGLNVLAGPERLIARAQSGRGIARGLTNSKAANAGILATTNAAGEGVTETLQEVINQYGRAQVDPTYDPMGAEAMDAYGESFAGGATLGGMFGGVAGGAATRPKDLLQQRLQQRADTLEQRGLRDQQMLEETKSNLGIDEDTLQLGYEPSRRIVYPDGSVSDLVYDNDPAALNRAGLQRSAAEMTLQQGQEPSGTPVNRVPRVNEPEPAQLNYQPARRIVYPDGTVSDEVYNEPDMEAADKQRDKARSDLNMTTQVGQEPGGTPVSRLPEADTTAANQIADSVSFDNVRAAIYNTGLNVDGAPRDKDNKTDREWLESEVIGKSVEELGALKSQYKNRRELLKNLIGMVEATDVQLQPNEAPDLTPTTELEFTSGEQAIYDLFDADANLTYDDIAKKLGTTKQTVSKRLESMKSKVEASAAAQNLSPLNLAPALDMLFANKTARDDVNLTDLSSVNMETGDLENSGISVRRGPKDTRAVETQKDTKAKAASEKFIQNNDPTSQKAQNKAKSKWAETKKVYKSLPAFSSLPPEAKDEFTRLFIEEGGNPSQKWLAANTADVSRIAKPRLEEMAAAKKKAKQEGKPDPTWDQLGKEESQADPEVKTAPRLKKAGAVWEATRKTDETLPAWDMLNDEQQDRFVRAFVENDGSAPNVARLSRARPGASVAKLAKEIAQGVAEGRESNYFSVDGAENTGTTSDAILDALEAITGSREDSRVVIHDTLDAAREANPDATLPDGAQAWVTEREDGSFTVNFVAENIAPGREMAVFLHEVGAHIGMENLLGADEYNNLLDKIWEWSTTDQKGLAGTVARKAIARADAATQNSREDLNPEVLAYFIEEAVKAGVDPSVKSSRKSALGRFLKKIVDLVKAGLNKLKLQNLDALTPQDIVDLAMGLANISLRTDANLNVEQRFSMAEQSTYSEPTGAAKKLANKVSETLRSIAAKGVPSMMSLHALAKQYSEKLPSLARYYQHVSEMESMQVMLQTAGHKIASKWRNLSSTEQTQLSEVMKAATENNFNVDQEFNHKSNEHLKKYTPEMRAARAKYKKLSPEAKAVYAASRDKLMADWKTRGELYKDIVGKTYDSLIGATDDAAEVARLEKERDAYLKQNAKELSQIKVYFPLRRFGAFILQAMSKEFKAVQKQLEAENLSADAKKRLTAKLTTMKKQQQHYYVAAFESEKAAKRYGSGIKGAYDTVTLNLADRADPTAPDITKRGVKKIHDYLTANVSESERKLVETMLAEMYVAQLPEGHALTSELKRQGVQGASTDMLRAFASTVEKNAFFMSRFKYRDTIADDLIELKKEARENDADLDVNHEYIYQEVKSRHQMDMQYLETPVINFLAQTSGMYHLVSPSYWMVNATQPWFIGAPVIAAKFGMGRTTKAMSTAFVDAGKIVQKTIKPDSNEKFYNGSMFNDLDVSGLASVDEQAMLDTIINRGRIDINVTHDLGVMSRGGSDFMSKIHRLSMWPAHQVESMNRLTVSLATYRLARAKGMAHQKAVELADQMIIDTQIDYSSVNAPKLLKSNALGGLGKLVFQFRKYQHAMMQLIIQNAANIKDPEARKVLYYMFGAQFLTAGAVGLPLYNVATLLADALIDDDDEDGDAQTQLYNMFKDNFGTDGADILMKGIPAALGADLSKRTGMGNLFAAVPYMRTGGQTGSETVGNFYTAASGPATSIVVGAVDAAKFFADGQYARGIEAGMPKGIKDVLKAYRMSQTGITGRNKQEGVDPDDISEWDIVQRALGLTPLSEAKYYEAKQAVFGVDQAINNRRSRLMRDYSVARISNDFATANAIRKEIREFNKEHREYRIKSSSLKKSIKMRLDARRQRVSKYNLGQPSDKLKDLARFAED